MARQVDALVGRKAGQRVGCGKDCLDAAVADCDGVVFKNRARWLDRYYPAGANDERYLGVPWISTSTRRLGARHSISALRFLLSGQDLTGSVLP